MLPDADACLPTRAGPNRLVVSDLVLAGFSLSDPSKPGAQVAWPLGLLWPGVQAGTTLPRRLYLQDTALLVDRDTLQQYLDFFRGNGTLIYTVRLAVAVTIRTAVSDRCPVCTACCSSWW